MEVHREGCRMNAWGMFFLCVLIVRAIVRLVSACGDGDSTKRIAAFVVTVLDAFVLFMAGTWSGN